MTYRQIQYFLYILPTMLVVNLSAQTQADTAEAHRAWQQGMDHLQRSRDMLAGREFVRAAQLFQNQGEISRSIDAELMSAESYYRLGDCAKALEQVNRADKFMDQLSGVGRKSQKLSSQLYRAACLNDSARYDLLRECIQVINDQQSGLEPFRAQVYHDLGLYFFEQEVIDSAGFYLEMAFPLAMRGPDDYLTGRICFLWPKILRRQGDYAKAVDIIKEGILKYRNYFGEIHTVIATGYNDLAINQKALGDLESSGENFRKALDIRQQLHGRHSNDYARILNNTTLHFLDVGEVNTALELAQQTVDIFESLRNPDPQFHVASYNTLARVYRHLGKDHKAFIYFQKTLELQLKYFPQSKGARFYYLDLGRNALDRDRPAEAIEYFHAAMSLAIDEVDPADVYSNPGRDNPSNYQSLHSLCVLKAAAFQAHYGHSEDRRDLSEALKLYNLADYFAAKNRTESRYQKSKLAFSRKNLPLYEGAIKTCLNLYELTGDPNYLNQAYIFNEKSKSLTLLENLLEVSALYNSGLPDSLLREERIFQDSIAFLRRQLLELQGQSNQSQVQNLEERKLRLDLRYESFKERLERDYPRFYQSKYDFGFTGLLEIQRDLSPQECVLSYFVGKAEIFRFFVTKDHLDYTIIARPDSLGRWISDLREMILDFDPTQAILSAQNSSSVNGYIRRAGQLYSLLLQDLQDELMEGIYIIPSDVLNYIPFGILLARNPEQIDDFSAYPFFAKNHFISYNYSSTLSRQMALTAVQTPRDLLGIAPEFRNQSIKAGDSLRANRYQLAPLSFNQEEVKAIIKEWSGSKLLADKATKAAFVREVSDHGIFHFATHALVNEENADLSFLAFAPAEQEDPFLYLSELYDLQLPAHLVTLSACETNLGPLQQGEGIASLAKGFSYAGAKSIVTSLWEVEDRTAKEIMVSFYRKLAEGGRKDVALQSAKMEYLENAEDHLAHPYYWAAYVAIGDMSSIPSGSFGYQEWLLAALTVLIILLVFRHLHK